ncbi:MAG: hypothetical protein JXA69_21305 [Phycisphaerae bacterium]|nr:hypothetical protein [Phycisphaerae bacterium]
MITNDRSRSPRSWKHVVLILTAASTLFAVSAAGQNTDKPPQPRRAVPPMQVTTDIPVPPHDPANPRLIKVFQLQHARAMEAAQTIAAAVAEPDGTRITCAADPQTNSLVISATEPTMKKVTELIASLDTARPETQIRTQIIRVEHGNVSGVARAVSEAFRREGTIAPVPGTNQLIIKGPPDMIKQAIDLASQLDIAGETPSDESSSIRIYDIRHANVVTLRDILANIFCDAATIQAEQDTHKLIVQTNANTHERIASVLGELDRTDEGAADGSVRTQIVTLRHARLTDELQQAVELAMSDDGAFAVDASRNLVIVRGTEAEIRNVEALLETLDQPSPPAATTPPTALRVRVIWLMSGLQREAPAPPADIAEVIEELERIGVTDLRLAAQAVVQTAGDRGEFKIGCAPMLDNPCELRIVGQVRQEADQPAHLDISIRGIEQVPAEPLPPGSAYKPARSGITRSICDLETTVVAPLNHKVVLCASPIDTATSVLIVQVLPGT